MNYEIVTCIFFVRVFYECVILNDKHIDNTKGNMFKSNQGTVTGLDREPTFVFLSLLGNHGILMTSSVDLEKACRTAFLCMCIFLSIKAFIRHQGWCLS